MIALYILLALQLADIVTTIIALKGHAHEGNPVLAKLMHAIGTIPALLLFKGSFVAVMVYLAPAVPVMTIYALIAMYVYVVISNIIVIRKG